MKYLFASIAAVAVIFGAGYALACLALKKSSAGHRGIKKICLTVLFGMLITLAAALLYFGSYYHADEQAQNALLGNADVAVSKTEGGYFFDGPSGDRAVVFYPGAKVECEAYATLALKLAESGYDCFLADMPLNFAMLGENVAKKFMDAYSYDTWVMAGHSMGGIMAAKYAADHPDKIGGIVLLASYITDRMDDSFKLCSIYGSEDGCLERNVYENARGNWPENSMEYVIEGGNHAQFGSYGAQKGDGTAQISAEKQQEITVDTILKFFQ